MKILQIQRWLFRNGVLESSLSLLNVNYTSIFKHQNTLLADIFVYIGSDIKAFGYYHSESYLSSDWVIIIFSTSLMFEEVPVV